ncbi:hypothetical protein [Histidinibacterium aquaticum]|uniref:Flagellar biosynthesis protein FlgN n=1 Tax=Histidinibacterium aquaticum TaxID=2613962 RepID=A0A5J5GPI0_9RHOB|nr:hypothetical protein [Histidinibacterium aquaticum]KAA9009965.1 hypothetical protein F3S47_01495 [Histidinibacterium aquaticum]
MTSEQSACVTAIKALNGVLRQEIKALQAGDFVAVQELQAEKERLGAELKAAASLLDDSARLELRREFAALAGLIEQDRVLLERVASAAGDVGRELRRIRDRHSLGGLYGKSGQTQERPQAGSARIDASL